MEGLVDLRNIIENEIMELGKIIDEQISYFPASEFEKNDGLYKVYINCQLRSMESHLKMLEDILKAAKVRLDK